MNGQSLFGLELGGGLRGGLGGGVGGGVGGGQPDRAALLQALMQRLAPLQQQNPQAYQQIVARIQERMGGGLGQAQPGGLPQQPQQQPFLGGFPQQATQQAGFPQQAAQQFAGGFPQVGQPGGFPGQQGGVLPQLAMLQQQNPQVYQAVMQRLGSGPSPAGPDATAMNRFPNRAPARFPNPLGGT